MPASCCLRVELCSKSIRNQTASSTSSFSSGERKRRLLPSSSFKFLSRFHARPRNALARSRESEELRQVSFSLSISLSLFLPLAYLRLSRSLSRSSPTIYRASCGKSKYYYNYYNYYYYYSRLEEFGLVVGDVLSGLIPATSFSVSVSLPGIRTTNTTRAAAAAREGMSSSTRAREFSTGDFQVGEWKTEERERQ